LLIAEPKDFRQRRPDGNSGWTLGDARRVLYCLPELTESIAQGRQVFLVGGEKEVLNLAKLGITATNNALGAGAWRPRGFQGADVVIIADGAVWLVARHVLQGEMPPRL
jgi:hypothetical protein